jgi:hypothetical protein
MVTVRPKYTGWEAKLNLDKLKGRLVRYYTHSQMKEFDITVEQLGAICEANGFTLHPTKHGYSILLKAW